jgi:hypothetical protein
LAANCFSLLTSLPAQVPETFSDATCTYGYVTTTDPTAPRDRLPALDILEIPGRDGKCFASWNSAVPVRCGFDKTRFLVANLGANGRADTESWPAVDANGATATTARVIMTQDASGELQVRCIPRWISRDPNVAYVPDTTSVTLTQTGESLFFHFFSFFVSEIKSFFFPFSFFPSRALLFPHLPPFFNTSILSQPARCT